MSGSFGKSKSKNSSDQRIWDQQAPYLQDLYSRAQGQMNSPTPYRQMGNQSALNFAGGFQDQVYNPAMQAYSQQLNATDVGNNPYLAQAVQGAVNPMIDNFKEQIMPSIGRGAVASGQYGGSRQGVAEGLAAGKLMQGIGDVSSQMYSNAYGQGLQAQGQAMGQAGNIANLGMVPSQIYQGIDQQRWGDLGNYAGLLGGPQVLGSSSGRYSSISMGGGG